MNKTKPNQHKNHKDKPTFRGWSFKSDSAQAAMEMDYSQTVEDASPRGQR